MNVFLSYTRLKDQFNKVSDFRERLQNELEMREPTSKVFQDSHNLREGQHFPEELEAAVRAADVLLILMSPAWLKSDWCRREFEVFNSSDDRRLRLHRIVPVLWVQTPELAASSQDPVARQLAQINYADWRAHRYESWEDPNTQRLIGKLAESICTQAATNSPSQPADRPVKITRTRLEAATENATSILIEAVNQKNQERLARAQKPQPARRRGYRSSSEEIKPKKPNLITASLFASSTRVERTLELHLESVQRWSETIRFTDLRQAKLVLRVYVELDTFLLPLSTQESLVEQKDLKPLKEALGQSDGHCAILGGPGAGKTTSLQKLCADYFADQQTIFKRHSLPLLLRLRDLAGGKSNTPVYDSLQDLLGIRIEFGGLENPRSDAATTTAIRTTMNSYLDDLQAVILLDGFDEISSPLVRESALKDIECMASALTRSRLIITCRSPDFRYRIASIEKFEIAPLSNEQVSTFAQRWLTSPAKATEFLKKVKRSPYADTTIRPLTLAHLCAIYERIQDIPEKPKSVYRRVVNLLLEEWDSQREVKRYSSYADFEGDRKLGFLAHLAFELTTEAKELRFNEGTLRILYSKICAHHGLPFDQRNKVISEIESHSGLIVESGYEYYEFAHKSLQEFLAADYVVRLPSLTTVARHIPIIPNELAIATALSSMPTIYLSELVLRALAKAKLPSEWYATFVSRLILEKPDLHLGTTALSVVSVLALLDKVKDPAVAAESFKALIPTDADRLISEYYVRTGSAQGFAVYKRTMQHKTYPFPQHLRIPESLVSNARFAH